VTPGLRQFVAEELSDNLRRHVDRLAGLIGPRHVECPRALEAAATLIQSELHGCGLRVERQEYQAAGATVANLVGEIIGEGQPGEIVVVGAHYDTLDTTPGADDNASAVAVLIEAARMTRYLGPPRRTVRFVAFACEEPPHFYTDEMGSQVYARQCWTRRERITGMICLEMVGYFTATAGSQQMPAAIPRWLRRAFPRQGDFVAAVGNLRSWRLVWQFRRGFRRATRLPLYAIALPERIRDIGLSDNSSFWDQGYPALMVTDTSYLRNPHYHLPSDTPDTLDYDSMAGVAVGVLGGLAALSRARWPRPWSR
jgi:Zn-dependent M28 family amino/carboxypeptidase